MRTTGLLLFCAISQCAALEVWLNPADSPEEWTNAAVVERRLTDTGSYEGSYGGSYGSYDTAEPTASPTTSPTASPTETTTTPTKSPTTVAFANINGGITYKAVPAGTEIPEGPLRQALADSLNVGDSQITNLEQTEVPLSRRLLRTLTTANTVDIVVTYIVAVKDAAELAAVTSDVGELSANPAKLTAFTEALVAKIQASGNTDPVFSNNGALVKADVVATQKSCTLVSTGSSCTSGDDDDLSGGQIAGIVIGVLFGLLALCGAVMYFQKSSNSSEKPHDVKNDGLGALEVDVTKTGKKAP